MTKADIDTAIDDERRKTGTSFISTAEKTRYERQALYDISGDVDFYAQDASSDFSFVPEVRLSAVNKLSAVAPDLKTPGAIVSIEPLSSRTKRFKRVRPEDFQYITYGSFYAQSGRDLWIFHDGKSGDTIRVRYVKGHPAQTSGGTLSASMVANSDEPIDGIDPEAVINFVLWKVFRKEGKRDDAREAKKRYDELLKDMMQENEYRRSGIYDRQSVEHASRYDWEEHI